MDVKALHADFLCLSWGGFAPQAVSGAHAAPPQQFSMR